jgi:polysaccharide deacetylase 2 family uncharacterized protein YibQ
LPRALARGNSSTQKQMGHLYYRLAIVIIAVLVLFIFVGAFWETEYNPLQKFSSSAFPVETAGHLRNIIETELARPGILEITLHEKTIHQETLTWTAYDYVVHVEKPTLFSDIVYALSESISDNGGQIFQTYFQAEEQKASIVIGVDSFITHTLVLTWDTQPPVTEAIPQSAQTGSREQFRVAIVIDDLGASEQVVYRLLDLQEDFTFSVLPHLEKSTEIAMLLHEHQKEVLLHLPMEPQSYPLRLPGKGGLMMNMGADMIRQTIQQDLQSVPYAVGVNNHMGSRLTTDPEKMQIVLQTLRHHDLFFLDSRTTSASVAYKTAQQLGVKSAERKVFLDVIPQFDFVKHQLLELASLAEQGEPAIAIGHPKEATLKALKMILPEFKRRNIKIVRLSQFVR